MKKLFLLLISVIFIGISLHAAKQAGEPCTSSAECEGKMVCKFSQAWWRCVYP